MIATSLAPFLAPAAGTIAFVLLLCVSIGAVLALNPFPAGERLTSPETDNPSLAWTGLSAGIDLGTQTDDSMNPTRLTAEKASAEFSTASRQTSANSERSLQPDPIRTPEPHAFPQPVIRWWGINE